MLILNIVKMFYSMTRQGMRTCRFETQTIERDWLPDMYIYLELFLSAFITRYEKTTPPFKKKKKKAFRKHFHLLPQCFL